MSVGMHQKLAAAQLSRSNVKYRVSEYCQLNSYSRVGTATIWYRGIKILFIIQLFHSYGNTAIFIVFDSGNVLEENRFFRR
jgi:hypothetical protein